MHSSPFSVAGMTASTSGHHSHQFHGPNLSTWGSTSTSGPLASSFSDTLSQSRSQYQSGYLMVCGLFFLYLNHFFLMFPRTQSSQNNVRVVGCCYKQKGLKFLLVYIELTARKPASRRGAHRAYKSENEPRTIQRFCLRFWHGFDVSKYKVCLSFFYFDIFLHRGM
jgi:hypothetical protein